MQPHQIDTRRRLKHAPQHAPAISDFDRGAARKSGAQSWKQCVTQCRVGDTAAKFTFPKTCELSCTSRTLLRAVRAASNRIAIGLMPPTACAAPPSPFSRRLNSDGERASAKWQSSRRWHALPPWRAGRWPTAPVRHGPPPPARCSHAHARHHPCATAAPSNRHELRKHELRRHELHRHMLHKHTIHRHIAQANFKRTDCTRSLHKVIAQGHCTRPLHKHAAQAHACTGGFDLQRSGLHPGPHRRHPRSDRGVCCRDLRRAATTTAA